MERKVRQLDNDVQSIYEFLAGISATQTRHGNRLDELDQKLDHQGNRLDEIDQKLGRQGNRFDEIDQKLDRIVDLLSGGA